MQGQNIRILTKGNIDMKESYVVQNKFNILMLKLIDEMYEILLSGSE